MGIIKPPAVLANVGSRVTDRAARITRGIRRGLRQRWMRGTMLFVSGSVLVVIIAFSVFFVSSYYAAIRTGLEAKALTATNFFSNYITSSYYEYYEAAQRYTKSFADRDKLELQFLSNDGRVITSSIGVPAGATASTSPDVIEALEFKRISMWIGERAMSGERVMSVSAPMIVRGEVVGILRHVTSLRNVDRQIALSIFAVTGAGVIMLLVVIGMNMMFIRAVIAPVGAITRLSRRIADGGYGTLIENEYRDEIGEMVRAINEMSTKIAQAEKLETEFISSISHELRTPLTAITGWGETLAYNENLDADTRNGISIILKEARRLTKMVEDLLEFTRMEDGRFTLSIEMIDVGAEVEDAIFTFRELLHQDELDLRYAPCEDDLPLIPGDPDRLKQVFLNLLDNAAKYGRTGRHIDISVQPGGDLIAVIIRDYGKGIPDDELTRVTQKFYKGSNAKERGSGIGLAVCEEIIRYHGGRIDIENITEPGADGVLGLRVTVWLPVTNAATLDTAL